MPDSVRIVWGTAVDMVFLLLHGFETFLASPWQK